MYFSSSVIANRRYPQHQFGDNRDTNPIKYIGRERLSYNKDVAEHYKENDYLLEQPEEKEYFNYYTYDREEKVKSRK